MLSSRFLFALVFLLAERSQAASLNCTSPSVSRDLNQTSTHASSSTTRASLRTSKAAVAAGSSTSAAAVAISTDNGLNPNALKCQLIFPNDALSAKGLSTPFRLQPPCSMVVDSQQAFVEAAIYDPATGNISIYHPLVSDAGVNPATPPVVPTLPANAIVGLWFGFNGDQLELLDADGNNVNKSPKLKKINCVNGLPGQNGDLFGQVSFCNAQEWFKSANEGIAANKIAIPDLGVDKSGEACITSRSFKITDADPSDNVPTQYILTSTGTTAQSTKANAAALKNSTVINNASDEALLTNIIDPLIGCTPFMAPSLTDPGTMVPALVLSELQAAAKQQAPVALVPLNDPQTVLTRGGGVSTGKTNAYRLGVNQPQVGAGDTDGSLDPYCKNLVAIAPPFLKTFETTFTNASTPDDAVGNNLFTFLCNRYLQSLASLTCPASTIGVQPIVCKQKGGVATSCDITLANGTATASTNTEKTKTTAKAVSVVSKITDKSNPTDVTSPLSSSITVNPQGASTTSPKASSLTLPLTVSSTFPQPAPSASTSTTTIVITTITFFIFPPSLGGVVPPVLLSPNTTAAQSTDSFIVLEEIFVSISTAATAACMHQFNSCAALAGSAFSGSDCLAQLQQCQGVASTASKTADAPTTVLNTATLPATLTAETEAPTATGGGGAGGNGSGGDKGNSCPLVTVTNMNMKAAGTAAAQAKVKTVVREQTQTVTVTNMVTQRETVTITALVGTGAAAATGTGQAVGNGAYLYRYGGLVRPLRRH